MNNGRVNFGREGVTPASQLPGFGYRTKTAASEADDAIRGNVTANPLNQAFFSPPNVQIIQNQMRKGVFDRSSGEFLIDDQSVDELMIVMRAMYLQYGKNQPDHVTEQIVELNKIVTDWCVPRILSECSMHKTYLHDIQHLPVPLQQPVHLSQKGTKSGTLDRFF